LIRRIVGFEGQIVRDATKPDGTPRKLMDVSRLNGLGWKASTPLDDGVEKLYDWYCGEMQA
jgi:GDP-L-fucose synthase